MVGNTQLRVCVVDDDDAVRDSMCVLLDAHGVSVDAFALPTQFLEHYRRGTRYDCLIFDLHMPEMTGLELTEKLRSRHVATPVIILTGRTDSGLSTRMERAGVARVLAKPVTDDDLVGAIASTRMADCDCPGP